MLKQKHNVQKARPLSSFTCNWNLPSLDNHFFTDHLLNQWQRFQRHLDIKMAHTYVKVKHREKILKLRPATVSVTYLAIIFKLEAQQGIYIHSEEEAEIILPSESGTFLVEDFSKTYVVNGGPAVSVIPPVNSVSQSPSTALSEKPLFTSGKFCLRISLICLYVLLSSPRFLIKVILLSI